ncbi:hypothetical protein [Spongiimicrobium salis]|uniref:hypothetical protein n=1 Tax=Spongiimicrobium salis TaxID=1667022 RepID=UPI00374D9A7B
MKNVGIWLDKEKAHIVRLTGESESFETLYSKVDFFNPKGGSRSKTRWGPQDVIHDRRYLEREKHQLRSYFQNLADQLNEAQAIALFGPAETNEKFRDQLWASHKHIAEKVVAVVKADSMTDNQVKALVRKFFEKSNS